MRCVPRGLGTGTSHRYARRLASAASERKVLERLLAAAKQRQAATAAPPTPPLPTTPEPGARRTPFLIQTYDAIGPLSLQLTSARFDYQLFDPASRSRFSGWWWSEAYEPQAIMLRGHSLREDEVPLSVRAVATCGEDPSAIDVEALTRRGIPVFSTPDPNLNPNSPLTTHRSPLTFHPHPHLSPPPYSQPGLQYARRQRQRGQGAHPVRPPPRGTGRGRGHRAHAEPRCRAG